MTFLKRSAMSLVAILCVLLIVAYLLPSKIHVQREVVINAPPEAVFNEVNDLKKWSKWSPWHLMDPEATYNYSGPDTGVGATSTWKGEKVGEGTQKIETSEPYKTITTSLDFGDQGLASSEWTFTPSGDGTKVVWGFDTDMGMNPVSRYFGLVMDRMIGADYEKGLGNLKSVCEASPDGSNDSAATPDGDAATPDGDAATPDQTNSESTDSDTPTPTDG